MGGVESDSMKSARKAKDKLYTRPVKEHQKLVSELCMGRNAHGKQESRDSVWFLINTQVQSHALLHRRFGT